MQKQLTQLKVKFGKTEAPIDKAARKQTEIIDKDTYTRLKRGMRIICIRCYG